jgi:hypothetical protein
MLRKAYITRHGEKKMRDKVRQKKAKVWKGIFILFALISVCDSQRKLILIRIAVWKKDKNRGYFDYTQRWRN